VGGKAVGGGGGGLFEMETNRGAWQPGLGNGCWPTAAKLESYRAFKSPNQ
jgi:hypothetical protein